MNIYSFGLGVESAETSPEVLGGKGAGLVWMDQNGVKVPPGFIIPTEICSRYRVAPKVTMAGVAKAIKPWMKRLEAKFGYRPLVSVRSGARTSMPGMMDTILNVGLDVTVVDEWVSRIGAECVGDSRKRLIEMYGSVVKGIAREKFEGLSGPGRVALYESVAGEKFPDAEGQLMGAIEAVFKSWDNERAKTYRSMYNIPDSWGTAVTVQAMVFGNMNDKSCTGVLFTRNCNTGEAGIVGEWLENAQGEDVVAGIRTPKPLKEMGFWNADVYGALLETATKLEVSNGDVQDVEFTVQDGELFILQTRNAKRTSMATVRIAVDLYEAGALSLEGVFKRVKLADFMRAQGVTLDPTFKKKPAWTGLPACAGVVTGKIVKSAEAAINATGPVILVSKETTPDDIAGMAAAVGVVTMTGGNTSHAAVVARGMNRCCITGLGADLSEFVAGKVISLDGSTGRIWKGEAPTVSGKNEPAILKLQDLMTTYLGCQLIGEDDGDVLDLTGLVTTPDLAAKVVQNVLQKRPSVVVDVSTPKTEAQVAYEEMFGSEEGLEALAVKAIVEAVGADKVKFLTSVSADALAALLGVTPQLIATVATAEELVEAPVEYILANSTPAMEKLAGWKAQIEGIKALLLGAPVKGGYASRAQIAAALLAV